MVRPPLPWTWAARASTRPKAVDTLRLPRHSLLQPVMPGRFPSVLPRLFIKLVPATRPQEPAPPPEPSARKPSSPSATTRRWRNCTPGRLVRRWWPQEPPGTCGNCSARAARRSAGAAFKLPDADYISFFVATRVARPSGLNQRPLLNRNQLDIAELFFRVYDTPRRFSCRQGGYRLLT